jgi:hypothetical protein
MWLTDLIRHKAEALAHTQQKPSGAMVGTVYLGEKGSQARGLGLADKRNSKKDARHQPYGNALWSLDSLLPFPSEKGDSAARFDWVTY